MSSYNVFSSSGRADLPDPASVSSVISRWRMEPNLREEDEERVRECTDHAGMDAVLLRWTRRAEIGSPVEQATAAARVVREEAARRLTRTVDRSMVGWDVRSSASFVHWRAE